MYRSIWLALAVFFVSLTMSQMAWGQAENEVEVEAETEALFSTEIDNIQSIVLDNGLEVVIIEDHSLPIVTVEIAVHHGALVETPDLNGLSHLYEHMFFKGNQAIPNQEEYMARTRELGMVWNGTTSNERVNYFFTLASERLTEGLQFMSDAIRTPLFDEGEFERERDVVDGEHDRNEASPYFYLMTAVDDMLWYQYPSRKDVLGDREIIQNATVEQMQWFQQTYYVPNNSALFIAGDVESEVGFTLAEEIFGSWERASDPFVENPLVEHPLLTRTVAEVVAQDVQVVTVLMSWHGPSVSEDPEATFAADVFSLILAQQAHRFQQNLVDTGLVLGVSLGYHTLDNTGPINLMIQTLPLNLEGALIAIHEEISHFSDLDYFTDEQLETAKTLLAVSELYSREQTASWAHTVSFWWAVAGLDYYLDYVQNLNAVTREGVESYVQTYIQDQPYVLGVLASPDVIEAFSLTPELVISWSD